MRRTGEKARRSSRTASGGDLAGSFQEAPLDDVGGGGVLGEVDGFPTREPGAVVGLLAPVNTSTGNRPT